MIIAVILVRVMESPVDEVIGVLAVRHGLVAAVSAVDVLTAVVLAVADVRELFVNRQRVLIDVIAVRLVEMAIVDEVDVPVVDDRRVTAAGAVDVIMIFVRVTHQLKLSRLCCGRIQRLLGERRPLWVSANFALRCTPSRRKLLGNLRATPRAAMSFRLRLLKEGGVIRRSIAIAR